VVLPLPMLPSTDMVHGRFRVLQCMVESSLRKNIVSQSACDTFRKNGHLALIVTNI
jgi:hypothetical protein